MPYRVPMADNKTGQIMAAKSAINTSAVLGPDRVNQVQELVFYVAYGAGCSAGEVVIEGAHDIEYGGVWANLGTVAWVAASKEHIVAVTGVHMAVRARISIGIVGGTVDVYAVGN